MGVGVYMLGQLPLNIFPETSDADMVMLQLEFEGNEDITLAREQAGIVSTIISEELGEDGAIISYPQASARSAVAQITLTPFTDRDTTSHQYINRIETRLSDETDIEFTVTQIDAGPPAESFPFAVQIRGENIDSTAELAEDIADFLHATDIQRNDGSELEIDEVRVSTDPNTVRRIDGARFVKVEARFVDDDITELVTATQDAVEGEFTDEKLQEFGLDTQALRFDFGQESDNVESFESTQLALIIAVIMMYFLLVIQFNSFSQPLLILLAVPFGLIGVAGGLMWAGHALSFFVMIGLIGLVGIVVNNAILLVDYANQERRTGANAHHAITEAVKQRFRPVVTTTLTTIGALTPLAVSDPFWEPLAITIIFGLTASSVLILTAFPYFYIAFERVREAKNKLLPFLK